VPTMSEDSLAMPLVEEDILGVIVVSEKVDNKPFRYFDQDILTTLSEQAVVAIKNIMLHKQQEKITLGSIKSLSALSGSREFQPHIPKTKYRNLIVGIAKQLKLPQRKIDALNYAALLHDVGKVGIPEDILKKGKSLTSKEYSLVKQHPSRSAAILKHLKALEPAIPIILHHHEKYDGSGYPEGLKADKIPLGARILAVVDALEAMITKRPYRRAKTFDQAIREIKKNSGTQFDPNVVDALLKVVRKKKLKKEKIMRQSTAQRQK
jgi:HD-GYP domain-containing protein (c-di-GMP phosphodiesterase class II)